MKGPTAMPEWTLLGTCVCPKCGTRHVYIPGTIRGKKCGTCFRGEAARRLREHNRSKMVPGRCQDCHAELPITYGTGRRSPRCAGCHRPHLRKLDTVRYYERRRQFIEHGFCKDCETVFPRTGRGGPVPRYCPECSKVHKKNRDRAHAHVRHARKRNLPTEFILPRAVYERDGWTCGICRTPIDGSLRWPDPGSPSIDHKRPLSRGGHHTWGNVQAAHLNCNLRKATKYIEESEDA